jgi:hypothetical protein
MRRGLETISVIGALVLVLIIVVILAVAFSNKFALFNKAGTCETQGGSCETGPQCPEDKPLKLLTQDCDKQSKICCKTVG